MTSVLGIELVLVALQRIDAGLGEPTDFDTVGDQWDVEERSAAVLADLALDWRLDLTATGDATR